MTTQQLDPTTETYTAETWRDGAECRQADPETFFPPKGGSNTEAKHTCLSCQVKVFCLDWAIENNIQHGVWGATSTYQRRNLRRQQDQAVCTACGESKPLGDMGPRGGDEHWCQDCAAEGEEVTA